MLWYIQNGDFVWALVAYGLLLILVVSLVMSIWNNASIIINGYLNKDKDESSEVPEKLEELNLKLDSYIHPQTDYNEHLSWNNPLYKFNLWNLSDWVLSEECLSRKDYDIFRDIECLARVWGKTEKEVFNDYCIIIENKDK